MRKLIRSCVSVFDTWRDDIPDELQIISGTVLAFASFVAAFAGSAAYFSYGDIGTILYVLGLVPLAFTMLFPVAVCVNMILRLTVSFATNGEHVLSDEYLVKYIFGVDTIDDFESLEICCGMSLLGWIFALTVLACIKLPVLAVILGLFVGGLYLSRFVFRVKGKLTGHITDPNAHSNQKENENV